MYADGVGLYLQVTGDGKENVAKSWIYRFTLRGRARDMGLGSPRPTSRFANCCDLICSLESHGTSDGDLVEIHGCRDRAIAMAEGYIYILFNPAYRANQYKIGMTTKTPKRRALELSSATGVPQPFEVLYQQRVVDCQKAERLIHQRLARYRSRSNREFVEVPLNIAVTILNEVAAEVGSLPDESPSQDLEAALPGNTVTAGEINLISGKPKRAARTKQYKASGPISFEDHVAYTDAARQPILRRLRDDIIALDDRLRSGETVTPARRIAYKIPGDKNFMEVKVQRSAILVRLIETGVHDPRGVVRKIPETHGWGDLKDEIRISNTSDAEFALQFIKAAYQIAAARN